MTKHLLSLFLVNTTLWSSASFSTEQTCDIDGDVKAWAIDACLWDSETDNTQLIKVQECLKRANIHIKLLGNCDAKHLFKHAICASTAKWPLANHCLSSNTALGPALQASLNNTKPLN